MESRDFSRCVPHSLANTTRPSHQTHISQAPPYSILKSRDPADPVKPLVTNSIIHSPSFTFLVGPKHTKLTIQSGLAQHVSKPLHNLMNNGHTRESRHRIAVLEDEDVETFVAFCEYAYTGDYKVPQLPGPVAGPVATSAPRDDIRTGVVETLSISGRATYRSDSVSSTVPPPAPSPPPESNTDGPTARPEEEIASAISEVVITEAATEVEVEAVAEPGVEAVKPETQEDIQPDKYEPSTETHENIESSGETDRPHDQSFEDAPAELGEHIAVEASDPAGEGRSGEALPEYPSNTKVSKRKAKMLARRTKKNTQQQQQQASPLEDEPPASLTPPSTPPPQEPEVVEMEPQSIPEAEPLEPEVVEPEVVEAEVLEPEPSAFEDAPEETAEAVVPSDEAPASPTGSLPAPEAAPEWPQSTDPLPHEDTMEDQDTAQTDCTATSPRPTIDMSFAKQQSDSNPRTPGLSLWDDFVALQYNDDKPPTIPNATTATPSNTELPYLTFHAKVYVFATRYLIPALAQLCLRKLHTDLLYLPLGDTNSEDLSSTADEADDDAVTQTATRSGLPGAPAIVLDVLHYAYTRTTRLEPISPTSATQLRENELRRLVVHYAACRVKELARWHGGGSGSATPAVRGDGMKTTSLKVLLDGTPELASDLVYRMM